MSMVAERLTDALTKVTALKELARATGTRYDAQQLRQIERDLADVMEELGVDIPDVCRERMEVEPFASSKPNVKGCGHCRAHLERCKPCHYICPKCATVYTDDDCEHRRLLPHFGCPACGKETPVPGPGVPA